jgi:soluble lytic murein transglycosylase
MELSLINSAVVKCASARRTRPQFAGPNVFFLLALVAGTGSAQASPPLPLPAPRPTTATAMSTSTISATDKLHTNVFSLNAVPLPLPKPSHRPIWNAPSKLASTYRPAFHLAKEANWSKLKELRRSPVNALMEGVLDGLRLADPRSKAGFFEITTFLDSHPVWPGRVRLQQCAERALDEKLAPLEQLNWFSKTPPKTITGRLKWISALKQTGQLGAHAEAVRYTWRRTGFTRKQQQYFQRKHRLLLDETMHWQRLDRLLWLGLNNSARAMMPLVTPEYRRLAEARLRLRHSSGGVDNAVARVPTTLRSDVGLTYERLRWRHRKGLNERAMELLWDVPANQEFAPLWWKERSRQVHYALDGGRHEDAYLLAASHIQRKGRYYADAQWHAGWVALRYGNKPREAAQYFTTLHESVTTPISRARAAYWAGRALEVSGSSAAAKDWYAQAAENPTTYYGQLAAHKLPSTITHLHSDPEPTAPSFANSDLNELINTAKALNEVGQSKLARGFLRVAARAAASREDAAAIAAAARALGYLDISVFTARRAARYGLILMEAGYPLVDVPKTDAPEKALTLAIIRQESNFNKDALSRVGARGLMQLMPATAQQVARDLKIPYVLGALTTEPDFNLRLGASYLQAQLKTFGGSYVLAVAAYNAGPHRVTQWLKERGDPRDTAIDTIDWIERIPFAETRNYVQRVLEALHVYRLRLGSERSGWFTQKILKQ